MRITINGEKEDVQEGLTLLELLTGRGLDPRAVVAELNQGIVPREDYANTRLKPDDSLELLHFVGGG